MTERVVMAGDQMDRLVLMRSDLDRYEAQVIPHLQQEVLALREALRRLVEVTQSVERMPGIETAQGHGAALRDAERLLAEADRERR